MGGYPSLRHVRNRRQVELDYDAWYSVFGKLDSTIDQNSFGLTCVAFRDIQILSRKSLKIRYSTTTSTINSCIIDKLLSRHTQLETLSLGYCPRFIGGRHIITDSCLTPLLKYGWSTLHSLDLYGCDSITDTGVLLVASACPLLSVISLGSTSVSDHGLKILSKSCKSLKEVSLEDCMCITDHGIFLLNQNCHQLKTLRISGCRQITGVGFRECSPTLAHLETNRCCYLGMGVSQIVSGGGLEYLDLGCIIPPSSLRRLSIVLEPIGLGGFCSKLKFLNIARCSFADDDVIAKISRGCPLLQVWKLVGCNRIGISGWESIGLYCQNLETLNVAFCDNLLCEQQPGGLLSIGVGCKRLSVIIVDQRQYDSHQVYHFKLQRRDVKIKTQPYISLAI